MKIMIINGPNLNLLGKREPHIYGQQSFKDYWQSLKNNYPDHIIDCYQTNHEGSIIDKLQEAESRYDAVILNPAAYTHTSIAIADCIKAIDIPVVEVHISDISQRENFRKHSYITPIVRHTIMGQGLKGYETAVKYVLNSLK